MGRTVPRFVAACHRVEFKDGRGMKKTFCLIEDELVPWLTTEELNCSRKRGELPALVPYPTW